jgi:carboxypeptidase Taq
MVSKTYVRFEELVKYHWTYRSIHDVLEWDQKVYMPRGGSDARAVQMGAMELLSHKVLVSDEMGECIDILYRGIDKLDKYQQANVRETKIMRDRKVNVPQKVVEELAKTKVKAYEVWIKAKKNSDFGSFAPTLEKLIDLEIQYAHAIDPRKNPYEVLFQEYEPGLPIEDVQRIFENLKQGLVPILKSIQQSSVSPNTDFLNHSYHPQKQMKFCELVVKKVGLDFNHARLDKTEHPFTVGFAPSDVRITTRFDKHDLRRSIPASLHECGHAMYEQGLPIDYIFQTVGMYRSLGIHESQSRFYENVIGRSLEFWENSFPELQKIFRRQLKGFSPWDFYQFVNEVKPGFIRTEADEVTYNLHVLLRFEVEKAFINGELGVKEAPDVWNGKMKEYLGVTPPNDRLGILQDVHWSSENIGYFPTYTLGNLLMTQLKNSMSKSIPDMKEQIRKGKFDEINRWLRKNIHEKGRLLSTDELIKEATGEAINANHFLEYLRSKYGTLYSI